MTGEIALRGQVLPVGGLREKVLAAHRAGFLRVILPTGNESELAEVPHEVRNNMEFHLVEDVDEAFDIALVTPPKAGHGRPTGRAGGRRARAARKRKSTRR